jgi:glycosyltransferase involved in cell wall biosynthesis
MNRIPILFVHWGEEGIRGSERVLLDLLAKLDRERYQPFLWCNTASMGIAGHELDIPTEVSAMPILLGWNSPKFDIVGYRRLIGHGRRLIESHGIRLVHANSGAPNQWMVPVTRDARIPLVAHLHAIYGFRERCTLLLHQSPVVVGCSDAVLRPLRTDRIPGQRLRMIHNGVDESRLNVGDARGLRDRLGVRDDAVLLVGAGALIPLKGFDTIVRAVALAVRRGVEAHLAIAGDGPERAALEELAHRLAVADRTYFLGHIPNLGPVFRDAADIAVVASQVESFCLVAAEAGAMGTPTIATRVGGIPEVVTDGITGVLVPPGDVEQFAAAIVQLGASQEVRASLGAAARDHVLVHLSTDRMTRYFESLYAELLSHPAAAYSWSRLRFRVVPFARFGMEVLGRRLGVSGV